MEKEVMNLRNNAAILLVDDDSINLSVLKQRFTHSGFMTVTASNGQEGLERMDAQPFDAVVSDVMMPLLNGFELLQAIRGRSPWLPVILMSGHVDEVMRDTASFLGAAAVFQKPVNVQELISQLTTAPKDAAPPVDPPFATETELVHSD